MCGGGHHVLYLQKLMKSFEGQLDGGIGGCVEEARKKGREEGRKGGREEVTGIEKMLGIVK